jgi:hypothetical protein
VCPFQAVRDEAEKQRLASATLEKGLPEDPMAFSDVDLGMKKGAAVAMLSPLPDLELETAAMADALAIAILAQTAAVKEVPSCVL